ncbi:3-oxoacyl-[acyl-carrier protein] reductase, partial [hydrothermal vent metagenome]
MTSKRSENYLSSLFKLDGKVAVVTGAGGHLCGEMARTLAWAGCKVAILDLRLDKAEAVKNELNEGGYPDVIAIEIDVAKKEDHVRALEIAISEFDHVDILVNGAGINGPTPFFELTLDEWNSILESQITGTFLGCQVFGEHMVNRGSGSVINLSSASAGPPLSKAIT